MKKSIIYIIGWFAITFIISCLYSCNKDYNIPFEKIIYVPVKDTISEKTNIARIIELEHKCNLLQDSLNYIKDSIGEDLFIARYKLGRIKYYVDISKNGNNSKYLRGWCLRVLNE